MIDIDRLLEILTPERRPIQSLWRELGETPRAFTNLLETHRDELAVRGVQLHEATVSQVDAASILVHGKYYTSISRPARETIAVGLVKKHLHTMTADELTEVRRYIATLDTPAQAAEPTYQRQRTKDGRCYWYAMWRDDTGKQHKKYSGKAHPTTGELA